MNVQEFKAWMEGFEEAMIDAPTPEQWAKIKAKINSLSAFEIGKNGLTVSGITTGTTRTFKMPDSSDAAHIFDLRPFTTC